MAHQDPVQLDSPLADDREASVVSLDVDGAPVRVRVYSPTPPTDGPRGVILAVHGFRGDHHGLRRIINALPEYLFVVPDLPGFGGSGPFPGGGHTAAGYGRVIDALREVFALPASSALLGHSFGSVVASHYVAAHPDAFSRLVLINPICEPALEGSQRLPTLAAQAYYEVAAKLPRRRGEALLRSRLVVDATTAAMVTSRDPAVRAYVRDQHRAYFAGFSDPSTLLEAYRSSIANTVLEVAEEIGVPTLLVAGEKDPLGSVAGQERLARLIPDARLVMIPRVGHLIHYETPKTAAEAVREFLG